MEKKKLNKYNLSENQMNDLSKKGIDEEVLNVFYKSVDGMDVLSKTSRIGFEGFLNVLENMNKMSINEIEKCYLGIIECYEDIESIDSRNKGLKYNWKLDYENKHYQIMLKRNRELKSDLNELIFELYGKIVDKCQYVFAAQSLLHIYGKEIDAVLLTNEIEKYPKNSQEAKVALETFKKTSKIRSEKSFSNILATSAAAFAICAVGAGIGYINQYELNQKYKTIVQNNEKELVDLYRKNELLKKGSKLQEEELLARNTLYINMLTTDKYKLAFNQISLEVAIKIGKEYIKEGKEKKNITTVRNYKEDYLEAGQCYRNYHETKKISDLQECFNYLNKLSLQKDKIVRGNYLKGMACLARKVDQVTDAYLKNSLIDEEQKYEMILFRNNVFSKFISTYKLMLKKTEGKQ